MVQRRGPESELNRQTALRRSLEHAFHAMALALMSAWILYVGRGIIVPFVMAVIVVYVILGLSRFLARLPILGTHVPRWVRNIVSIMVIGAVLGILVSLIITNVNQVAQMVPQYQERLLGIIQGFAVRFGVEQEPTWTTIRDQVLNQIQIRPLLQTAVSSVSQIVAVSAIVFIYTGFLLAERATFDLKFNRFSHDPETVASARAIVAEVSERIGQYLALKTFVNVVLGLTSWAMMAVVGVEFAAFWAILIGLLNYIPYVGSFLGVLFPVILSVLQFEDLQTVVLVFLVLTAAQTFVGSVLEPYVMGNSLNLSPSVILLGLGVWSALWGIPGALLSVPIMASMVIVLASFESTRPVAVLLSRNGRVGDPIHFRIAEEGGGAAQT
jgi:AI-2 transport protein TqsA